MCFDSFPAGWAEVKDMHVNALNPEQLHAAALQKEIVTVWRADLTRVNKDRAKAKNADVGVPYLKSVLGVQISSY